MRVPFVLLWGLVPAILASEAECEADGTCAASVGDRGSPPAPPTEDGGRGARPYPRAEGGRERRGPQHRWDDYLAAVDRAMGWIDRLGVDPVALQRRGVKGKKKLGEAMAAYTVGLRYRDDEAKADRYRERMAALASKASGPNYHNLGSCDDKEFKQNSMSYLRVLRLMKMEGTDASEYEEELGKIKGRLDEHLANRGPWQRAMFARYYDEFSLSKPPILRHLDRSQSAGNAVVSRRLVPDQYDKARMYELTHEVFVAFDYGFSPEQTAFSEEDVSYLSKTLPTLVEEKIASTDGDAADILAEFVTCMAFLGLRDHPSARRGVDTLLDGQNESGTWGDYEASRARVGDVVDQLLYLHTTYVALQALHESYRRPVPPFDGGT